ncbi:MAG: hypothetical protein AAF598_20700 [Bacteroidota bacterium]
MNVFLQIPSAGDAVTIFPTFTAIGRINFSKEGGSPADLTWAYNGGTTETVAFLEDESTQIFVANPGSDLQNLTPSSSLPFEMAYFNAYWLSESQDAALLDWGTETETNTGHFEIQRSWDARTFQTIGTIEASGNSTDPIDYQFVDEDLARMISGDDVYYRLKEVDLANSDSFTEIRVLTKYIEETPIEVFPAPFNDKLNVLLHGQQWLNQDLEIRLTDNLGTTIREQRIQNFQGNNLELTELQGLGSGVFFLSVRRAGTLNWETQKLIKF